MYANVITIMGHGIYYITKQFLFFIHNLIFAFHHNKELIHSSLLLLFLY